jgi:hormone-sensitive lipase
LLFFFHQIFIRFLQKDVKMTVYPGMPHGFLNYDAPNGMKEAKVCVEDAAGILKELL